MSDEQVGIVLDWTKAPPNVECYAWVKTAVEIVQQRYPDLHKYLRSITFVPVKPLAEHLDQPLTEDERWVIQFIQANARYRYEYGPTAPGEMIVEYLPYVDFIVALVLHELAHVIYRMENPDEHNILAAQGRRFNSHNVRWSQIACDLYREFGCEKAALMIDGSAYRSLRKRHALLLPSEYTWAMQTWHKFDTGQFGALRAEFTNLFCT